MNIPKNVQKIMDKLERNGFKAYIVGGAVRDYLLDLQPHDYDIFTNAKGKQILKLFPNGKVMGGEERQQKILTVVVSGIEVSSFRKNGERTQTGNDLKTHCSTCDFTINSLACDSSGKIIDLEDGQTDINNKVIRAVGNPIDRFKEDPLRILRGYRFSSKLGFKIDKTTEYAMKNFELTKIKPERIITEFKKIIDTPKPYDFLEQCVLSCSGNLSSVFSFDLFDDLTGGEHHAETVKEHMIFSAQTAAKITSSFSVVFSALFHDIGKFKSVVKKNGNNTFKGHEKKSKELVELLCNKFKLSTQETKQILFLVENHMKLHVLGDMNYKNVINFFRTMEDLDLNIFDVLTLHYSDIQGNVMNERMKFKDFIEQSEIYSKYVKLKMENKPFRVKDLPVSGKDLINTGLSPGKEIGIILNRIYGEVLEGNLENSRPALMFYIKNKIKNSS